MTAHIRDHLALAQQNPRTPRARIWLQPAPCPVCLRWPAKLMKGWREPAASLHMNQLSLRNSQLGFKTLGKLPINVEEFYRI